ncbi:hypothetical protein QC281_45315, partial [Streptomyces sp. DH17]|nr:hypothetical protein [Streptomyces sp. DH17]
TRPGKKLRRRWNEITLLGLDLQVRTPQPSGQATAPRPRQHPPRCWRGFWFHGSKWQQTTKAANGADAKEDTLPISALLARIRRLVPKTRDRHYDEIVRNFGVGALRPPPTPMSDGELAKAIAEFLKDTPSTESVATLGRRLDPSTPL